MYDSRLREYMLYDPLTGNFYWSKPPGDRRTDLVGKRVGSPRTQRYLATVAFGQSIQLSRLAWEWAYGEIPVGYVIDHRNGLTHDNRLENLRCTTQANNVAAGSHKNNKTGYRGVSYHKQSGLWRARVGRKKSQGGEVCSWHKTVEEAALAYNALAQAIYGEFAQLNALIAAEIADEH